MDWNTIFMNISADCILIDTKNNDRINIHRNFVEKLLWKELVELHKKIWFQNVIVLNWPWWFTNLRAWTLCLNVLNTLLENQLSFYDISKIELYNKAYKLWYLSRYWIIYIWQKRNIWLWDFEKNEKIWQYSFDELKNLEEIKNIENVFVDNVEDKDYYPEWMGEYPKYHIMFEWNAILLINEKDNIWNQILIDELDLKPLKSIAPNYMMEPNITIIN